MVFHNRKYFVWYDNFGPFLWNDFGQINEKKKKKHIISRRETLFFFFLKEPASTKKTNKKSRRNRVNLISPDFAVT